MLQKNRKSNLWFAWVYMLAPPEIASQFSSVIQVRSKSGSQCVTYQGAVHSVDMDVQSVLQTADCLIFTDGVVKNLVQGYPTEHKDEEEVDELKFLLAMQYEIKRSGANKQSAVEKPEN